MNKQSQKGGENSKQLQAGRDIVFNGVTYPDAKQIAQDVFDNNYLQLSQDALRISQKRALELVEAFLEDLKNRYPEGVSTAQDPDMQHNFFHAQQAYARSGDTDQRDFLVALLVERAKQPERTLEQIVLNESIGIMHKLTTMQIDILSTIFSIRYTQLHTVEHLGDLLIGFLNLLIPFSDILSDNVSHLQHLEYAGCGSFQTAENTLIAAPSTLGQIFRDRYPGFFSRGMDQSVVDLLLGRNQHFENIICKCHHDLRLWQLNFPFQHSLQSWCDKCGYDKDLVRLLKDYQIKFLMNDDEIYDTLNQTDPRFKNLENNWDKTNIHSFFLTSVGIVIAIINIERKTKIKHTLSEWIKN